MNLIQYTKLYSIRYKKIPYNDLSINRYKSKDNLLKHARYTKGLTKGVMYVTYTDQLIGYIGWEKDWIISLEVTKLYQRKGFASKLLNDAIKSGCNKLSVSKSNHQAVNLYLKHGWIIDHEDDKMYYMKLK